jgi:hypothetical protein
VQSVLISRFSNWNYKRLINDRISYIYQLETKTILTSRKCLDVSRLSWKQSSTHDCTAHSAVLDLGTNTIRPLYIETDTWCSSGQFNGDGTLVQTGGDNDGFSKVTYTLNFHLLSSELETRRSSLPVWFPIFSRETSLGTIRCFKRQEIRSRFTVA